MRQGIFRSSLVAQSRPRSAAFAGDRADDGRADRLLVADGSHRNLLSAVLFADRGHSTATGCSPLPVAIDGVGSILWNDDSTSEFNFRVNTNPLADRFGLEANITLFTHRPPLAGRALSAGLPASAQPERASRP